jgi:hypothetical protein
MNDAQIEKLKDIAISYENGSISKKEMEKYKESILKEPRIPKVKNSGKTKRQKKYFKIIIGIAIALIISFFLKDEARELIWGDENRTSGSASQPGKVDFNKIN